jgi:hypothetical protein
MAGVPMGWLGGVAATATGAIPEFPVGFSAILLGSLLGVMLGGVGGASIGAAALIVVGARPRSRV